METDEVSNVSNEETVVNDQVDKSNQIRRELCRSCQAFDVTPDKFIVNRSKSEQEWNKERVFQLRSSTTPCRHGTFTEILKRSIYGCTLCKLLAKTINEYGLVESQPRRSPSYPLRIQNAVCSLNWEIDGRETAPNENRTGGPSTQCLTRRIHVKWSDPNRSEAYLVYVAPEQYSKTYSDAERVWGKEFLFLGHKITPGSDNQALVKSWLDLCLNKHVGPCCEPDNKVSKSMLEMISHSYFGVIDVMNMQLTDLPLNHPLKEMEEPIDYGDLGEDIAEYSHSPYAALSYVWGSAPTYRTTTENVLLHRTDGGIGKIFHQLPKSIQDAIELVRKLGIQYIWIDALCIVQDSPRSWKLNAYNMNLIYGNATLTICAADGEDSSAGLPAMHPTSKSLEQSRAQISRGLRLMVTKPPETYIRASAWNTRAWTFQERLLSKRCLIFTAGRVFFQCRSTGMSQDIYADRHGTGWSLDYVDAPMQLFRRLTTRAMWVYMKCIPLYSARQLSQPEDILAAFSGMTNLLRHHMKSHFVFGLPTSHFDLALLWDSTTASERRRGIRKTKDRDAVSELPSWSWAGWNGTASYKDSLLGPCLENISEWLRRRTFIEWHIRDENGDLRPLCIEGEGSTDQDGNWQGYAATNFHDNLDSEESASDEQSSGESDSDQFMRIRQSQYRRNNRASIPYRQYRYPRFIEPPSYPQYGYYETHLPPRPYYETYLPPRPYPAAIKSSRAEPFSSKEGPVQGKKLRFAAPRLEDSRTMPSDPESSSRRTAQEQSHRSSIHDEDGPVHNRQFYDMRFGQTDVPPSTILPDVANFKITLKDYPYKVVVREYESRMISHKHPVLPILQFFARHTWLYTKPHLSSGPDQAHPRDQEVDVGRIRCHISDSNGDWCGSIVLDKQWLANAKSVRHEFIAISEAKNFTLDECESWTYYIPKDREQSEWDLFFVMLIERNEEKWERVGIGKVFKDSFRDSTRKEIMLG